MPEETRETASSGVPYPPQAIRAFVGPGDFVGIGNAWRDFFVESAGLAPGFRVLDVGSGIGRIAIPLTEVMGLEGSYEGLEIKQTAVDWCKNNISSRYPNFRFSHLDVLNQCYNPERKFAAAEYPFPFGAGEFDLVILTSVFTHMFPADMEHYLQEIGRVLKPGGKCVITFYLLNEYSRERIADGTSKRLFKHPINEVCATSKPDDPEQFIAFDEAYVRRLYEGCRLRIDEIQYGGWSGREPAARRQDVILAHRTS